MDWLEDEFKALTEVISGASDFAVAFCGEYPEDPSRLQLRGLGEVSREPFSIPKRYQRRDTSSKPRRCGYQGEVRE
jgi:hypothetical protein